MCAQLLISMRTYVIASHLISLTNRKKNAFNVCFVVCAHTIRYMVRVSYYSSPEVDYDDDVNTTIIGKHIYNNGALILCTRLSICISTMLGKHTTDDAWTNTLYEYLNSMLEST